jgi:hypothetical protein
MCSFKLVVAHLLSYNVHHARNGNESRVLRCQPSSFRSLVSFITEKTLAPQLGDNRANKSRGKKRSSHRANHTESLCTLPA